MIFLTWLKQQEYGAYSFLPDNMIIPGYIQQYLYLDVPGLPLQLFLTNSATNTNFEQRSLKHDQCSRNEWILVKTISSVSGLRKRSNHINQAMWKTSLKI